MYVLYLASSSLGSSLSRVSSSPSSTPTDCSESHSNIIGHHVLLQTNSAANNHHTTHTSENLELFVNEEIAPPITKRPERTKSIVSLIINNSA